MKRVCTAALLAVLVVPASAETQTEIIRITGYVPVICHADFVAQAPQPGALVQLGTITEFCNAGSGYSITADYTAGADPGVLLIDGMPVPLSASGHSLLVHMDGPRAITQSIAYQPGSTPLSTISIQLQAASI